MCRGSYPNVSRFLVTRSNRGLKVSNGMPLLALVFSVVSGLGKVAEAGPAIDSQLEFTCELNVTRGDGRKRMEMDESSDTLASPL